MDMLDSDWAKYWEGRLSNGPVAVEVLASRLNVELADYVVAGAQSNTGNAELALPNSGASGQVEKFKAGRQGQSADPQALYFVMIGAMDFYGRLGSIPPRQSEPNR
jgi:cholinesterase